jgi:phage baseplate assembly protein W
MDDIFGQDIKLDATMQAVVAANGELVLTTGAETGVQDIRIRLFTPLGSLFYDTEWGSLVHNWFLEENSESARMGFEAEMARRVRTDPRVQLGSVSCTVTAWDENGIAASLSFTFIEEDHPYNLVITLDSEKKELVISDVRPAG